MPQRLRLSLHSEMSLGQGVSRPAILVTAVDAFFRDGLQRCTDQGSEAEEGEAQLELSTQPDGLRFRESSSFFPN